MNIFQVSKYIRIQAKFVEKLYLYLWVKSLSAAQERKGGVKNSFRSCYKNALRRKHQDEIVY